MVDGRRYREMVGCLTYLSVVGRPDISADVSIAAQKCAKPEEEDEKMVDRIFRYLVGTPNVGIEYSQGEGLGIEVHTDADGQEDGTRCPRHGSVVMLAGGPITWGSRLARIVTTSTAESELVAVAETVKVMLYLEDILQFVGVKVEEEQTIWSDNSAAVFASGSAGALRRTKHFDIRYLFILQHCRSGKYKVQYVPTDDNVADIFTKPLGKEKHRKFAMRLVHGF